MARQTRRVVITGTGTVTPFGLGISALWSALCEGKSSIGPCRTFDFSGFPTPFVAQIADELFDVKAVVPKSHRKATKVMSRDIELAVGAATEAINHAKIITKSHEQESVTIPPGRFGCHIGIAQNAGRRVVAQAADLHGRADADETARDVGRVGVKQHDGDDGECAEPVDVGTVGVVRRGA